ncbi:Plant calmodulin-binding protein-related, putative isoform 1 [Theobroma cacao]|uniref:Plant calmodulin-binding protein-related, putative isoform 1 n=1 Tax=Theobroma cacao TaxID=3641 RepID=A0A061EF20_THECC|nr:Plant calmodulin-binding protein-related, putative isoform 1 [Theobroma cacao]EOY03594.1 Plant calmodulin-binding protein-related, putative isoform 1 [Theobroma cacao]EOY03595.1 Plant calmodulin-binding protein-related, putative isoform 1 [Theobroma cacao]
MAEESFSSPVTPDITKPVGGNLRRNSLAGTGSANSGEKTLPRYLRASTGSCHDFCKYGKKHESEEKARHYFPKRIIKKPCDEPNSFESLDLPQRKETSAVKSKSFPNSRAHTPNTSNVIKLQVSKDPPDRKNSKIHEALSKKEKATVAKLKLKHSPNSRSRSYDISDVIKLEVPTNSSDSKTPRKHEVLSEAKQTSMAKLRLSPNLKSRLSDAPKFMQQDGSSSSERVQISSKEVPSKAIEKSFSKRHTTSLKLKSVAEKNPSSSVLSEGLTVRRNSGISDMKMGKRTVTSKVAVKKVVALPRASLSPRPYLTRATSLTTRKNKNLKVVPPQKNQNKVNKYETEQPLNEHSESNNDILKEKTLYVIKMETQSDKNEICAAELSSPIASSPKPSSLPISPSLSYHSERDQDESEYSVTEVEDDSDSEYDEDEAVNMEEAEILEGENGGRPRKAGTVISNDKDGRPVKLSFRRGKVVDIQSENNGPRRLKFRRGRVLGENQNIKAEGRRTYRRRGADGDTNDDKPSGEKVVLRHQDMQGKKDDKGLFNNVIEETASKLVETRKSKVKALVGAFETVISLQDTKPSANTVT